MTDTIFLVLLKVLAVTVLVQHLLGSLLYSGIRYDSAMSVPKWLLGRPDRTRWDLLSAFMFLHLYRLLLKGMSELTVDKSLACSRMSWLDWGDCWSFDHLLECLDACREISIPAMEELHVQHWQLSRTTETNAMGLTHQMHSWSSRCICARFQSSYKMSEPTSLNSPCDDDWNEIHTGSSTAAGL